MRLKGLLVAGVACTMAFGTAVTAEAKPHDAKAKQCAKNAKHPHCDTTGGTTTSADCPLGYRSANVIELGPGTEAYDLNDNSTVCYDAAMTFADDTPRP